MPCQRRRFWLALQNEAYDVKARCRRSADCKRKNHGDGRNHSLRAQARGLRPQVLAAAPPRRAKRQGGSAQARQAMTTQIWGHLPPFLASDRPTPYCCALAGGWFSQLP